MLTYLQVSNLIETKLVPNTNIIPSIHQDVEKAILEFIRDQWLIGDIKEVDCTNDYIAANFDSNGKGIGERDGWHICNGLNNTRNRTGRVSVGYGTVLPYQFGAATKFPSVGNVMSGPVVGGNRNAVIINHTHPYQTRTGDSPGEDCNSCHNRQCIETGFSTHTTSDANVGVSGTDKNMQPYIVTLFIQKISNP
jgi:hypothetical protein